MKDKGKILATFRIDPKEWEDFKALALASGKTASAVLLEFVRWYRAGHRISPTTSSALGSGVSLDNLDSLIDERIAAKVESLKSESLDKVSDERIENRLAQILDELEELQGNLSNIESALDNRIEKLEQAQKQPVELEALAPLGKRR